MSQLIVAEPRNTYRVTPPIVVDCSVLAALLFEEPGRDEADRILTGKALFAPWLIDHEMISVGLKKVRSGLADVASQGLERLSRLRVVRRAASIQGQWLLAKQESLSAYDAAYLQLAIELHAPLATFDRTLGQAAERVLESRRGRGSD